MTSIGRQLFRTFRSLNRLSSAIFPRHKLPFDSTPATSLAFSTTASATSTDDVEPKIDSLEDLENLLNTPAYKNRGDEFNKALQLEYEFFKYNGQLVPSVMTDEMWLEIRGVLTVEDRLELYRFLQLKERYKTKLLGRTRKGEYADRRRRALLAEMMGGMDKVPQTLHDERGYSLLGPTVSVTRKIDESFVRSHQVTHLPYALNFGQPLVFDLGLDYQMSNYEGSCFISQMKEMYGSNRAHWEPYNLYLCNYNPRNVIQSRLVEGKHTEKWLWNVTRRCFTEVFPKEKIVYLTARSRIPLSSYSHDAVYVLGACVDQRPGKDDMSKIKELGLQHAFFDVKPYFSKKGMNSVPLNQLFRALMDQRDIPGNLSYAYRHFARRRFQYRELAMNQIAISQEQMFVNKRTILLPKYHDLTKYEFRPKRTHDDEDDDYDDERGGGYKVGGGYEGSSSRSCDLRQRSSRQADLYHDDDVDPQRGQFSSSNRSPSRSRGPKTPRDYAKRKFLDQLDEGEVDELDLSMHNRILIKDY